MARTTARIGIDVKSFKPFARVAVLATCISLAAACGKHDPAGNEFVEYDDGVLIVEGQSFEREPSFDDKTFPELPGRTVVQPKPGNEPEALEFVRRYGLSLEGRSQEGWLLVKVPDGYEQQWASAFTRASTGRIHATTDTRASPTPIATLEPSADQAAQAGPGAAVPSGEPSDADVRRLAVELYARIERAGGFPATATATGQQLLIRSKIFDAQSSRASNCRKPDPASGSASRHYAWACATATATLPWKNPCKRRSASGSDGIRRGAGRWIDGFP